MIANGLLRPHKLTKRSSAVALLMRIGPMGPRLAAPRLCMPWGVTLEATGRC